MNSELLKEDLLQIEQKGMNEAQIEAQLENFRNGFEFLKLKGAAAVGDGIIAPTEDEAEACIQAWNDYKAEGHVITKFVPASGAASRMFKNMFEFLNADYDVPTTDFEKVFFAHIHNFAFFDALNDACFLNEGKGIDALVEEGEYRFKISGDDFKAYGQSVLEEFKKRAADAGYEMPQSYEGVRLSFKGQDVQGWMLLRLSLHDPVMPLNIEGGRKGDLPKLVAIARKLTEGFDRLDRSCL